MTEPPGSPSSDELVQRAIRDLIHSVPGEEETTAPPEASPTSQPWAETASPSAKSKRPLEAVLAEYAARVEASPDARANLPSEAHPSVTFYERFGRAGGGGDGRRRRRRRVAARRRRGGAGGGRGRSG
ncbi:MAG TPA: hypothetical protein VEK76_06630 [Candidatus Binatia bacterium]|nr:hypothetical protein [Candidatus Binatia bacterium]